MKNSILITIIVLSVFLCGIGLSINEDTSKHIFEYSDIGHLDEVVISERTPLLMDYNNRVDIYNKQQIIKESFVKHIFHPPR
ncbi:MAG: hypothetical protein NTX32_03795 [Candidatus Firestonebacteria bacterium]|nr:hypothetical protein [Candidatus Firestonebacteria bacterium]